MPFRKAVQDGWYSFLEAPVRYDVCRLLEWMRAHVLFRVEGLGKRGHQLDGAGTVRGPAKYRQPQRDFWTGQGLEHGSHLAKKEEICGSRHSPCRCVVDAFSERLGWGAKA